MDSKRIRPGDVVKIKASHMEWIWVVVKWSSWWGKFKIHAWDDCDKIARWVYPGELYVVDPCEPFVQLEVAEG